MSEQIELENGLSKAKINVKKGAALEVLDLVGRELIKPMDEYHYQSSLLFPFPNRLSNGSFEFEGRQYQFPHNDFGRPNALHGLLHDQPFEVIYQEREKLSCKWDYLGQFESYPFPCQINIDYTLQLNSLSVRVKIINTGDGKMPFGFGWHPYFLIPTDVQLKLPKLRKVEVDELMIPTGKVSSFSTFEKLNPVRDLRLDTCFQLEGIADKNELLMTFRGNEKLLVWQDKQFPYVQLFTPEDRKTFAIEPMTCNIDALNNRDGLIELNIGEEWFGCFGLAFQKD